MMEKKNNLQSDSFLMLSNWIFKSRENLWKQGKTKEEVDRQFPMVLNPQELLAIAKAKKEAPSVVDCVVESSEEESELNILQIEKPDEKDEP